MRHSNFMKNGKANNPYMGDSYDANQPTKYISYLDANNLYGWACVNHFQLMGLNGWCKMN